MLYSPELHGPLTEEGWDEERVRAAIRAIAADAEAPYDPERLWPVVEEWDAGGGCAGVVASAVEYLDEELLVAVAELVWQAGPPSLEKGPGICHGTAGSGWAFLKVFERTGTSAGSSGRGASQCTR